MNSIKLCELELEQLQELTLDGYPLAALIYIFQFRPRMNFDSCTVGDRKANTVKESWLVDCVERRGKRGSHHSGKKRSRQFVQRQIIQLVKYELLARLAKPDKRSPMRFYFPLAARGLDHLREERTVSGQAASSVKSLSVPGYELSTIAGAALVRSSVDAGQTSGNENTGLSEHIPVNRNIKNNNISIKREGDVRGDGFCIPKDWQPADESVLQLGDEYTYDVERFDWHVTSFVFYWLERGESRPDWNSVFVEYTKKYGLKN